jgi:hypothetical protein
VGRRLAAVAALALCLSGSALAATAGDPLEGQEWWLSHIGADPATAPPAGIPITIVDSGTDPTHPEFASRPNTTFLNGQSVVGREEYHGTIVASVAAAPENGVGIAGVYPTAALQIFDASPDVRGISDAAAIAGILTAAQRCPGVINLSFGSTSQNPQLHDAILTAVHNGCLVVAAAGNSGESGSPATYPAAWPHVFTVGATDEQDEVVSFSTTSPATDVAAPGVDIVGAVPLTRDPSGFQSSLDGTSFSAPITTAAAAWIWTLRPTLTAYQLAQVLRSSAHDIGTPGFDVGSGAGLLNIPAALTAPVPPDDPGEPNDDVEQVKPGSLFEAGEPPLTTPAKPSIRVAGSIDSAEDPRDFYRIWVPAKQVVRVSVSSAGSAAARIWGGKTVGVDEGVKARRRDLKGPLIQGGANGSPAYVEVLLTGRSTNTRYLLTVKASKR